MKKRRKSMTFAQRVHIGIQFSDYVHRNNLMLPSTMRERKIMFIRWYIERYRHKSWDRLIRELSEDILYIKIVTVERLLFNEG